MHTFAQGWMWGRPHRSDFLTELQRYEPFLTEPDVGVALDPEWRMGPDERPADGVGHVEAAELNAVSRTSPTSWSATACPTNCWSSTSSRTR